MTETTHPVLAQRVFWLGEAIWQEPDPTRLVEQLIDMLRDSGIPLQRVNIAVSTLHPEIVGVARIWKRETDHVESLTGNRGQMLSPEIYDRSPFRLVIEEGAAGIRRRLERDDCLDDLDVLADLRAEGATDYVAIATGSFGSRGGTLCTWTTDRPGGFTTPELVAIAEHARLLGHVLAAHSARETARNLLDTYVGSRARARILDGDIARGRGTSLEAAIWLSDIRDFTALTERLPPDELLALLDAHFDTLIKPVQARGGEVLKLMGDAVLAVFPTDIEGGAEAACMAALAAAREARAATAQADKPVRHVVALHFGTVTFGNVGASNRLDFTVIGPAVNLASRLNSLGKDLDCEIVLSADFAAHIDDPLTSLGRFELRGIAGEHEAFTTAP